MTIPNPTDIGAVTLILMIAAVIILWCGVAAMAAHYASKWKQNFDGESTQRKGVIFGNRR